MLLELSAEFVKVIREYILTIKSDTKPNLNELEELKNQVFNVIQLLEPSENNLKVLLHKIEEIC